MTDKDITHLPINNLQPNPLQPRGVITPDSLSELVDSIKKHGVLQPLTIAHTPAGYQIIAGERRWRAAKLAGLVEIPVNIVETTPQGMLEMAIVENVQRTDLNPIDRGKSFDRLISEFHLSNSEIAARISKSPAFVSNSLRLLDLPDALKDGLISGVISEGHARALAAIPETQPMIEAYKMILKEGGSVRRAEALARIFKNKLAKPNELQDSSKAKIINELIAEMASSLQSSLGKNTSVKMRRSRIETAIQIVLKGTPEETEGQLEKIYKSLSNGETKEGSELSAEDTSSDGGRSEAEVSSEVGSVTKPAKPPEYSNPFEPFNPTDY
ncbi:ParB/RepB/Spo0J family partition protein [Patescibacteria group bacterium]|nr:ParB/RepB/Spo0J family partition protein [Patescibacteria group bacterium]MBU1256565.1 ParB/RepB/Spo0J family partition protein [Patescibacteria group bacterium]MBU1457116.1 ParB/RepB/Spo0J family partition protein [Patescibacteria group bacterium]